MNSWANMGGYGVYVWGAYAVFACVLVFNVWRTRRITLQVEQQLKRFWR